MAIVSETDINPAASDPILIIGSGAMACLFAAHLCACHQAVVLLDDWLEALSVLEKHGVTLIDGPNEQTYPLKILSSPGTAKKFHLALVLVKSRQTLQAAQWLRECLAPDGLAVTLQNGLGNREILVEKLGANRALAGSTTLGATLIGPGVTRQNGHGWVDLPDDPRLLTLGQAFKTAGIPVNYSNEIDTILWGKLLLNAVINPLTALMNIPNGSLLDNPEAHHLALEMLQESVAIARSQGIRLPYPEPSSALNSVLSDTANNLSSMLQDVSRGTITEIDAICGVLLQFARQNGVAAPTLNTIFHLVKAIDTQHSIIQAHQD